VQKVPDTGNLVDMLSAYARAELWEWRKVRWTAILADETNPITVDKVDRNHPKMQALILLF
jgi:hypothetical protein